MKTIHYPNIIRSHLVTIAPMRPFTPKSTSCGGGDGSGAVDGDECGDGGMVVYVVAALMAIVIIGIMVLMELVYNYCRKLFNGIRGF